MIHSRGRKEEGNKKAHARFGKNRSTEVEESHVIIVLLSTFTLKQVFRFSNASKHIWSHQLKHALYQSARNLSLMVDAHVPCSYQVP